MFSQVSACPQGGFASQYALGQGVYPSMHLGRGLWTEGVRARGVDRESVFTIEGH